MTKNCTMLLYVMIKFAGSIRIFFDKTTIKILQYIQILLHTYVLTIFQKNRVQIFSIKWSTSIYI